MKATPETVLHTIWSRSLGEKVYLPSLQGGVWCEDPGSPPANIYRPPDYRDVGERYFSPLRYDGPRQRAFVGKPGVIFADLDNGLPETDLPPSVLVISSPGHAHGYWFLHEPVDAVDWEPRAKGWTQALDADPGGWDITQVLRVPGTYNHKYSPAFDVYVQQFEPSRTYPLDAFPVATVLETPETVTYPKPSEAERSIVLLDSDLPLTARYWLSVQPAELKALGKIDRSRLMWEVERKMLEESFSATEIFHAMHFSAINKWKEAPHKLWLEIQKAALLDDPHT